MSGGLFNHQAIVWNPTTPTCSSQSLFCLHLHMRTLANSLGYLLASGGKSMSTTREMILFRFSMSTYCLMLMLAALSHDCDSKHTCNLHVE